jgi:hypothetical protein
MVLMGGVGGPLNELVNRRRRRRRKKAEG